MAGSDDEFDVNTAPIEVTYKNLKYEFGLIGLTRQGARFQADLSDSLLTLYKNGKVNKSQSRRQIQQTARWWRAQCAFRGLPIYGSIDDLQDRLRKGPNVMLPELVDMECKAKADWKLRNAADQKEAKRIAIAAGMECLSPIFSNKSALAVIKQNDSGVDLAAKEMGLQFKWMIAPGPISLFALEEYWIIVGRSMSEVDAKIAALEQEADDRERLKREEEVKAAHATDAKIHASVAEESSRDGDWDVTGVWKIKCHELLEDHGFDYPGKPKLELKIYRQNGTKVSQLFGQFSFNEYVGWLRFEDPTSSNPGVTAGLKRKREGDSFIIPLDAKPSATYPTWTFRWRGRTDCGDGYFDHHSDEHQCSITFSGKGGCTLSGTFESDSCSKCEFTGLKLGTIASLPASFVSIDDEWEKHINYQFSNSY